MYCRMVKKAIPSNLIEVLYCDNVAHSPKSYHYRVDSWIMDQMATCSKALTELKMSVKTMKSDFSFDPLRNLVVSKPVYDPFWKEDGFLVTQNYLCLL